jgi:pyrroline-5-carboxylate reductase
LAGTSIASLRAKIEAEAYIRAMPNLAALHQKAITSVTGDVSFREEALAILSGIGQAVWLESEEHLDIATGLGGSAPAWLALVAEALVDGAVEMGLPRETALVYLPMLFEGTGALLGEEDPAQLRARVSSPGGTTIAGLEALDRAGAHEAFVDAMRACYRRAQELS